MELRDDAIAAMRPEDDGGAAGEAVSETVMRDGVTGDTKAVDGSADEAAVESEKDPLLLEDTELKGRMLREDRSEQDCLAVEIAPEHVKIASTPLPEAGERIVVYLDEVGRLEGHVTGADREKGLFTLLLTLTRARRKKVKSTLEWLRDKKEGKARERRRHLRIEPTDGQSYITLSDGRRYPCEVLDISLSGASVRMDVLPAVGTYVTLGRMRGRVVRHHEHGIAIEFVKVADAEALRHTVRRL